MKLFFLSFLLLFVESESFINNVFNKRLHHNSLELFNNNDEQNQEPIGIRVILRKIDNEEDFAWVFFEVTKQFLRIKILSEFQLVLVLLKSLHKQAIK